MSSPASADRWTLAIEAVELGLCRDGDRVIINVVTLVAASIVEEIRLAIMALHFSGGGSRCRMMEIGVHSRRRGHVGGRGHSWRCTGRREIHLDMRSRRASSTVSSRRVGRACNALETVDEGKGVIII